MKSCFDVELINILLNCFEELGLSDLYPQLNSLGCLECRPKYRDILKENLKDKKEETWLQTAMTGSLANS